ncbi:hypothetical protein B566_EDAN015548 [Ephemera danica]|nr:hypothetical protein B566_EDAN015548 [Ephemera danica]
MVKTRRAADSHGNSISEMPVRDTTSTEKIINPNTEEHEMSRKYSDAMDETRNVRRRSTSGRGLDRELRNRVVISNGSRSSTRIRDRPDRYRPASQSSRCIILRPRSASHLAILRDLGRSDEMDTGTEEDPVTEDEDHIFPPTRRKPRRAGSCSELTSPSVDFESQRSTRLTNGHSSSMMDDSHEAEGIRRSTRKRKLTYDNFNQSWILGTQSIRGYRTKDDHTEEEEEEEEEGEEEVEDSADEDAEEDKGDEEGEDNKGVSAEGEKAGKKVKEEKSEGGESNEAGNEAGDKENFEDMYSRVKRPRRKRIMFSEDRPTRSRTRSRKVIASSEEDARSSEDEVQRPQSPCRHSKYHLRQRKPKVQHFQIEEVRAEPLRRAAMSLLRSPMRRKRSHRSRFTRSGSSSSSSDSDFDKKKKGRNRNMCLPVNFATAGPGGSLQNMGNKAGAGTNLADTDPMELDPTVRFSHVGGLDEHISCLKEMVVFPMLYPEVFDKYKVQPPKGVLFHGPPGTGKTLLARALANECSQGARRVAFFMRKGADCLSKWAYQMRPSIIFFDELDGLAPVRSCKQDQIHASIVSTLLALMDGLKNRGEVLLIGATNRIDAIDPALRRPGRFDRELFFPLPAAKERLEILNIHMSTWEQAPPPELVAHLADMSNGYCGSDLKALCTEAVIQGLRRRYPQIYQSSEKLLLDPGQVKVEKCDFQRARLGIVPAAHRVACAPAHRLAPLVRPLLERQLTRAVDQLKTAFPHCDMKSSTECKLLSSLVPHPKLLLTGYDEQGQVVHIGPALLHHMEHVSVHSLELGTLFGTPSATPEEVCIQLFREALRQLPAVLYIPKLERWWTLVPQTVQALLVSRLAGLEPFTPLLLLATTSCPFSKLPTEAQELFSEYREEVLPMENPNQAQRREFFTPLLITTVLQPPSKPQQTREDVLEKLPVAPPPEPPKLTEEQSMELYKKEEMTLRELRIFLREICAKLARNKQFFMFVQPVDLEEAPDYLDIIKEPMDLESIMSKIDRHQYECAADFLADIDLICRNALEYNPDRSNQGKMIRHRACYLHDTAHALIKAEMDSDFEDQCKEITKNRKKRAFEANKLAPDFVYTAPVKETKHTEKEDKDNGHPKPSTSKAATDENHSKSTNSISHEDEGSSQNKSQMTPSSSESRPKKRKSPWARGMIPSKKRVKRPTETLDDKDRASPGTDTGGRNTPIDDNDENSMISEEATSHEHKPETSLDAKSTSPLPNEDETMEEVKLDDSTSRDLPEVEGIQRLNKPTEVQVDRAKLDKVLARVLDITEDLPLAPLLDLHAQLSRIINTHSSHLNRSSIPQELEEELNRFEKLVSSQYK